MRKRLWLGAALSAGIVLTLRSLALAGQAGVVLPALGGTEKLLLWLVLGAAIVALLYGLSLLKGVVARSPGTEKMQAVSKAIEEGAMAYLKKQMSTMIWFVILITVGLYLMYRNVYATQDLKYIPIGIAVAFLMGVFASYGAGCVGMWLSVKANTRVANAALASFKEALELGFRAGGVSGMFTVGFGLLGATILFLVFQENAMRVLVGFGLGGCLAALFLRVGGGIFTKAADVGADLVGKVEAEIPENDPRNAAVIADNVGDVVGDCAGMAADVFESYEVTLVAAIILAAAVLTDTQFVQQCGGAGPAGQFALRLIIYALLVRAVGVFSSIVGIMTVRVPRRKPLKDPMRPISAGYVVSGLLSILGFLIVNALYMKDPATGLPDWRFTGATSCGIALAVATLWLTNYFTHPDRMPTTETAAATKTGPATALLTGMGVGLESTVWAIATIAATVVASMLIFRESPALAAYGIALSGLGLLTTTGFILAMDAYGPITDNALGVLEMSGASEATEDEVARNVAWLDAIGNTTKALTKGLAIATAVIAAISLFRSFIDEAKLTSVGIQVNLPKVFVGLMIGGALPFLFSSFALKAVGRAAFRVVEEVRRQFREHPGIMDFTEKPDYAKCASIVTATAQTELLGPGILAIATPILVAFALGVDALGGTLAGAILTGQLLAVFMANAGATWDNAKKKIEDGFMGGKGSESHRAAIIGDTVGDPLKDTAGPALNPMIKVMNLVGLLIAPFAIRADIGFGTRAAIAAVCIVLLGVAIAFNKRGAIIEP